MRDLHEIMIQSIDAITNSNIEQNRGSIYVKNRRSSPLNIPSYCLKQRRNTFRTVCYPLKGDFSEHIIMLLKDVFAT
jgi:hypothetical protein